MPASATAQLHDADVLGLLEKENRTYFAPGTDYRYSNSGYALLAIIVEKASGKSFAAFLRERIFEPFGMRNTGTSTVSNRAFGYSRTETGWQRTDQNLTSAVLGDGGIYTSIDDLAKWDAALYDHFETAFTPRVSYPKERLTVVVLTNRNEPEPYPIALAISQRLP
jgi:CubicO group peptidase (beta-lactamase class C family)